MVGPCCKELARLVVSNQTGEEIIERRRHSALGTTGTPCFHHLGLKWSKCSRAMLGIDRSSCALSPLRSLGSPAQAVRLRACLLRTEIDRISTDLVSRDFRELRGSAADNVTEAFARHDTAAEWIMLILTWCRAVGGVARVCCFTPSTGWWSKT